MRTGGLFSESRILNPHSFRGSHPVFKLNDGMRTCIEKLLIGLGRLIASALTNWEKTIVRIESQRVFFIFRLRFLRRRQSGQRFRDNVA